MRPADVQAQANVALEARNLNALHTRYKMLETAGSSMQQATYALSKQDTSGAFTIFFSTPPPLFFPDSASQWKYADLHLRHPIWAGEVVRFRAQCLGCGLCLESAARSPPALALPYASRLCYTDNELTTNYLDLKQAVRNHQLKCPDPTMQ